MKIITGKPTDSDHYKIALGQGAAGYLKKPNILVKITRKMENIRQEIESRLKKIEQEEKVSILYACESGSRAWGFPSADSDFFGFPRQRLANIMTIESLKEYEPAPYYLF